MAIKLICIDMDGTLLMDDHQVSEVDQAAIKAAVKQGVHVAITTGRVYNCARLSAKTIGLTTPIIASNGAFIGGTNGETIYENPLLIEDVRDFLEITTQHGLLAYLTANFGLISLQELPETNLYKQLNKMLKEDEQIQLVVLSSLDEIYGHYEGQILKGVCLAPNQDILNEVKAEIKAKCPHLEVVSSWKNNFEVMKKGSSKGEAVKQLTKYFNLTPDEVMCIGDSENDLSMIQFAGVGVAMGNATEDVKQAAQFITTSNKEGGVANAIEHFVLNQK